MKRRASTATIRLKLETSDPRLDKWQGEIIRLDSERMKLTLDFEGVKQELALVKAEVIALAQAALAKEKKK